MFLGIAENGQRKFGFSTFVLHFIGFLLALAMFLPMAGTSEAKPQFAAIAVDARTGAVISAIDPDGYRYPASLTKVMTLYVLFQDLKAGRIKLSTPLRISRRAASMAPSKLGVKAGSTITVEQAIKALVTKSANDVASAIGENLGGTEANFAARMTRVARTIGMSKSTFKNASGLPNPGQRTTARDMATLSLRVMRDFPQYYPYFRTTAFNFKGQTIRSHNRLVGRYAGTDGIKTGYIGASGFNLTTSTKRGDRRLVGVVLGSTSSGARNAYMIRMLDKAFPKAKGGRMIAALAGSSKGAKDPIANATAQTDLTAIEAPSRKSKRLKSLFGSKKKEAVVEPDAMASAAEEASQPEQTAEGATSKTVIAEADVPKVLEAKIEEPEAQEAAAPIEAAPAGKLPFKVKPAANQADVQLATATVEDTWNIQIGAYPTKKAAQTKLSDVRATGVKLLDGKQAFTAEAKKGNAVIYRARFSGFTEKAAKNACAQLKKLGQPCLTLQPTG